jgi:hypothetical protein
VSQTTSSTSRPSISGPGRFAFAPRAIAEHARDVRGRTRQPIDRILEHAGNAVVVFGRYQEHPVAGDDAFLEIRDGDRQAVARLDVAVVERDAVQGSHFEGDSGLRRCARCVQQRGVQRLRTQAAGNAEDAGHARGSIVRRAGILGAARPDGQARLT